MWYLGLMACHKITNQAIPRNVTPPLAVAQGLNLRDLTRFRLRPLLRGYQQLSHRAGARP